MIDVKDRFKPVQASLSLAGDMYISALDSVKNRFRAFLLTTRPDVCPCLRCYSNSYKRIISGVERMAKTIQCTECNFNVTSFDSFEDAVSKWNGFKVWDKIYKPGPVKVFLITIMGVSK